MSIKEEMLMRQYASPNVTDRSASVIMIDTGKLVPVFIALAILCGLTAYSFWEAHQSSVETRMLEYYVMEVDGKLMQAGIIRPAETWSARKAKELKPEQETKP
jgi:hypothetical protein